ncbi:coiled-coil protein [Legionella brunensis]|uniref:Coiled-coil protein n=2 Tax=Legionella brunensis TaxID=29422 RepID=A0A0W0S044_9GAMM|nr:hypothetical protein [Legionella brunensis]KTC76844.1 coiled-coil protein [Legionella brunensis]
MSIHSSLKELEARLPELEWKMSTIRHVFPTKNLPRGLFRLPEEAEPSAFIEDIKADLKTLAKHQSEYTGYYLAQRIEQKINVLVALCSLERNSSQKTKCSLQMITTRKTFVENVEKEISVLELQQQAIVKRLEQKDERLSLSLKSELGEIEKRLTLAKEALARVTKW